MNAAAENLNWLVGRFVQQVAAVRQAVVVSSDGLPLAVSDGVDREAGERLAAVASGIGFVKWIIVYGTVITGIASQPNRRSRPNVMKPRKKASTPTNWRA